METLPINNDANFRELEAHAKTGLTAKGYSSLAKKGSTSWINPYRKPADGEVLFKLCFFRKGIFFGARETWATSLDITLTTLGPKSETVRPSLVPFQGDYVQNTPAGFRQIDAVIALFPPARI